MLAEMLASGLFIFDETTDNSLNRPHRDIDSLIDYSDPWLFEEDSDMPPLPECKETFTPEEALEIILKDIRQIYEKEDAA